MNEEGAKAKFLGWPETHMNWHGYGLELTDGMGWRIVGEPMAQPWVQKLAGIMELKGCDSDQYPGLIIVRGENSDEEKTEKILGKIAPCLCSHSSLPLHGWKVQNLRTLHFLCHGDVQDIICDIGGEGNELMEIIKMSDFLNLIYERTIESGCLPFHAALIEMDGRGVVLAGAGGTGKSTCCRRIPAPWQALCDDETLIVRDNKKQYQGHPFPTWSNYFWKRSERTWNVQRQAPLSAIFFLEQGETDEVVPMGQGRAAVLITQSATEIWGGRWMHRSHKEGGALRRTLFENACELAKKVPTFKLRASPNGRFWEKMGEVLT